MSRPARRRRKPYSRMTVTLPTFLIIGLREMVKENNAEHPDDEQPWTVSLVLERWLTDAFSKEGSDHWNRVAKVSPEFKRAAEEWIRWTMEEALRHKRRRKR